MSGPEQVRDCTHWIGAESRHCKEADGVRLFIVGDRCPAHTPNALRGLPEAPPGPGAPRDWATPPAHRIPTDRDRRHLTPVPKTS
ncbi:hypothetical protein [Streptomyces sp. NBC_01614]|uniref:hypothetical protein n=1 Tax=Streptomyces sp. NBC_01614 TaxID=2975897 RepID=UPI003865C47D